MIFLRPTALLLVFLTGMGLAARGQTSVQTEAGGWLDNLSVSAASSATWVRNISRTSFAPTRIDALRLEFDTTAEQHRQLAPDWLLTLGASADYTAVPDYDLTSQLKLGPAVVLQRKFGLGPLAPVLQFNASCTYEATRLAGDRGWTAEAGVRLAKRILPELKVAVDGRWREHYASSDIFAIQQRSIDVEAVWDINARWRLTGSATWLQGGIVANAEWSVYSQAISGAFGPTVQRYYSSIPFGITNSYGAGWTAYNVHAKVTLWSAALAYALTEHATLEFRLDDVYVINYVNVRYPTESWGLGLNYRF